jgi:O-acetyl-ADP-ribose deacetylase (regulator of RNase III)
MWIGTRKNISHFYTTSLIAWLLIALFPVLLIFSLFPDSSVSGTIKGISMSGAIGAFIIIWMYGSKSSLRARSIDEKFQKLENDLKTRQLRIETLEALEMNKSEPSYNSILTESRFISYRLKSNKNKKIGIVTGDIRDVNQIDVWVNSENTNMQMSRFYESSISGIIRYAGAEKDSFGNVVKDLIADELRACMANEVSVQPGTVLVTSSGTLHQTNKVKKIFHVACVQGEVGSGYRPINDIGRCIKTCLEKLDFEISRDGESKSILFPLIGTGKAAGDLQDIACKLIQTAMSILENDNSKIHSIYFLTWTELELQVCKSIFDSSKK